MIPAADAAAVLCFGDSNTNGNRSDDHGLGRLPANLRWPGQLQRMLGDNFNVIEEGLGGRTTDLDYQDMKGRNGRAYFWPCLHTHYPLHVVIIMLGTNDHKCQFGRSVRDTARALNGYLHDIKELESRTLGAPRAIVVSPAPIDTGQPLFAPMNGAAYDEESAQKSRALAAELRTVAAAHRAAFLDASAVAKVGGDGVHLTVASHRALAALLAPMVCVLSGKQPGSP